MTAQAPPRVAALRLGLVFPAVEAGTVGRRMPPTRVMEVAVRASVVPVRLNGGATNFGAKVVSVRDSDRPVAVGSAVCEPRRERRLGETAVFQSMKSGVLIPMPWSW